MQAKSPGPGRRGQSAGTGDLMGAGMQFAASIILFLLLGMWLDRTLGTAPWLLVAGAALGGVAGFWAMYRNLVVAPRERDAAGKSNREDRP